MATMLSNRLLTGTLATYNKLRSIETTNYRAVQYAFSHSTAPLSVAIMGQVATFP